MQDLIQSIEKQTKVWKSTSYEKTRTLTTNAPMPKEIYRKLFSTKKMNYPTPVFKQSNFPKLDKPLSNIRGMTILSGLQKIHKNYCITLFRTIRFPTLSRLYETIHVHGLSESNYEQERILGIYADRNYIAIRKKIRNDSRFYTQPQERVVSGLPIFYLANDALQIHSSYRNNIDKVLFVVSHIPKRLFDKKAIELYSNVPIDLNYSDMINDVIITDFNGGKNPKINISNLQIKGVNPYELYLKKLPLNLIEQQKLGISFRFFILDLYRINPTNLKGISQNVNILKKYGYFLKGFFGDYNTFGRTPAKYLPFGCYEVFPKTSE